MWALFGIAAIITAIMNIVWIIRHRDPKWFRFASLSCTALTWCAFMSKISGWVTSEDWAALSDVIPSASAAMWGLTVTSIVINCISLFKNK